MIQIKWSRDFTISKGRLSLWKDPYAGWLMGTHEVTITRVGFWEGIKYLLKFNAKEWDKHFGPW
jgi:hypothetical protein